MNYHILNGDALAEKFPQQQLGGEVIVIREAFMDGPVTDQYIQPDWSERKQYIKDTYGESIAGYDERVMSEFVRMEKIKDDDQVFLWFEDDLFCQCNMWFALDYMLQYSRPKLFRVFPKLESGSWFGFGNADQEELMENFRLAVSLNKNEERHIQDLWKAFVSRDDDWLRMLSPIKIKAIRFQEDVIKAQLQRKPDHSGMGRPQKALLHIIHNGATSFQEIYRQFSVQEGIYGFADLQVKHLLNELDLAVSF